MKFLQIALAFFAFLCLLGSSGMASDNLSFFKKSAVEKNLSSQRYWHILGHYKKTFFQNWESEEDFPAFFNSEVGKNDPEAELLATIEAFFQPPEFKDQIFGVHPQCQFPARFAWLRKNLETDKAQFPVVRCQMLDEWLERLDTEKIFMVYPSSRVDLPASMFGHTFLRMDKKNRKGGELFNYSINYAAEVDLAVENPFVYSILGVFGGYDGLISMLPYYVKIREYEDFDLRDLWEYELDFTPEEINRFMLHLWELRLTKFDYFFFRENCSYHILSLLEAARPELLLQDRFILRTIPTDTIRLLKTYPGLVVDIKYRKSRFNRALQQKESLSEREHDVFVSLAKGNSNLESDDLNSMTDESQVKILDLYIDYLVIQKSEDEKTKLQAVKQRAQIGVQSSELEERYYTKPPETGHLPQKIRVAGGRNNLDNNFFEIYYRPAYHDMLEFSDGYEEYSSLIFFSLSARYYSDKKWALDELMLLGVENYNTVQLIEFPPPFVWSVLLSYDTAKDKNETEQGRSHLNLFLGSGLKLGSVSMYAGARTALLNGDIYQDGYRFGLGPSAKIYQSIGKNFKWTLEHSHMYYTSGDQDNHPRTEFSFQYGTKDFDIYVKSYRENEYQEAQFGFGYYY